MRSIIPKVGLTLLLAYCPIADIITSLYKKDLDGRILSTAIRVYESYTSGDNQAAADYSRKAIKLKERKELIESVQAFLPGHRVLHMIEVEQAKRRQFLREQGWDCPQ